MSTILTVLETLDFTSVLWLLPLAFALHEAEEWNITRWEHRHFVGMPPNATDKSARAWIAFVSAVGFVWCAVAALPGNPTVAAFVFLPAIAFVLMNAFQHVYWTLRFRQYVPGIVTSVVLLIPTGLYLAVRAVQQGYAPIWYAAVWAVPIVAVLVQTVRAGDRVTAVVRTVYNVGSWLVERIS
jgi:hypothetical protein